MAGKQSGPSASDIGRVATRAQRGKAAERKREWTSALLIACARVPVYESFHGSQMRELRVRTGAFRGARLGDGARAPAESPRRFHRFLHAVRACIARIQGRERIERGFDDRLDLRWRNRRSARWSRERIPRRSSFVVDSAPGARGLSSPVASAPAGKLLIRFARVRAPDGFVSAASPPLLCIWS
jgi:hypothetical protein